MSEHKTNLKNMNYLQFARKEGDIFQGGGAPPPGKVRGILPTGWKNGAQPQAKKGDFSGELKYKKNVHPHPAGGYTSSFVRSWLETVGGF